MASKSKRARMAPQRNLSKIFMYWAIAVWIIKLLIIARIQAASYEISGKPYSIDGAWLGADGENYLTGFTSLIRDGVFSMERISFKVSVASNWVATSIT